MLQKNSKPTFQTFSIAVSVILLRAFSVLYPLAVQLLTS
jgi:hypothetical protein